MDPKFKEKKSVTVLGRIIFSFLLFKRKKILVDNVNRIYPNKSAKEKKEFMLSFSSHLGKMILELSSMLILSKKRLGKKIKFQGLEHLHDALEKNKKIIFLTGHIGNWEMGLAIGLSVIKPLNGRLYVIRKYLKNKFLQNLIFKNLKKNGLSIIGSKGGFKQIISNLLNNNFVIFPMDQHININNEKGIAAEFMGKKAGTYTSLAYLVEYTAATVIPLCTHRQKDNKHLIKFYPELKWQDLPRAEDRIQVNTNLYNKALEKMIQEHPEQWLWLHRRWRLEE